MTQAQGRASELGVAGQGAVDSLAVQSEAGDGHSSQVAGVRISVAGDHNEQAAVADGRSAQGAVAHTLAGAGDHNERAAGARNIPVLAHIRPHIACGDHNCARGADLQLHDASLLPRALPERGPGQHCDSTPDRQS